LEKKKKREEDNEWKRMERRCKIEEKKANAERKREARRIELAQKMKAAEEANLRATGWARVDEKSQQRNPERGEYNFQNNMQSVNHDSYAGHNHRSPAGILHHASSNNSSPFFPMPGELQMENNENSYGCAPPMMEIRLPNGSSCTVAAEFAQDFIAKHMSKLPAGTRCTVHGAEHTREHQSSSFGQQQPHGNNMVHKNNNGGGFPNSNANAEQYATTNNHFFASQQQRQQRHQQQQRKNCNSGNSMNGFGGNGGSGTSFSSFSSMNGTNSATNFNSSFNQSGATSGGFVSAAGNSLTTADGSMQLMQSLQSPANTMTRTFTNGSNNSDIMTPPLTPPLGTSPRFGSTSLQNNAGLVPQLPSTMSAGSCFGNSTNGMSLPSISELPRAPNLPLLSANSGASVIPKMNPTFSANNHSVMKNNNNQLTGLAQVNLSQQNINERIKQRVSISCASSNPSPQQVPLCCPPIENSNGWELLSGKSKNSSASVFPQPVSRSPQNEEEIMIRRGSAASVAAMTSSPGISAQKISSPNLAPLFSPQLDENNFTTPLFNSQLNGGVAATNVTRFFFYNRTQN